VDPVLLLHGFPGGAATWDRVVPHLQQEGFETYAPDQRGYDPSNRPASVSRYGIDLLVGDVRGLLDRNGIATVHVVGHDWGGAVAWHFAARWPERVRALTVLSTPHPAAFARALFTSGQALRSWYAVAMQVPIVPEALLLAGRGALLRASLRASGLDAEMTQRYTSSMTSDGGRLSAALDWYRCAARDPRPLADIGSIEVPTTYVWSTGDAALGRTAAELTGRHVTGPYRFEVLDGASHWIPEREPARTSELVVERARLAGSTSG
jgi:pimeloyl-ACP methyl ester carboxylesterase